MQRVSNSVFHFRFHFLLFHMSILICQLGIYTHCKSRASVQTTGSDAIVITSSAIWLDCTHGYRGTNPYIGLISVSTRPSTLTRVCQTSSHICNGGDSSEVRQSGKGQKQLVPPAVHKNIHSPSHGLNLSASGLSTTLSLIFGRILAKFLVQKKNLPSPAPWVITR